VIDSKRRQPVMQVAGWCCPAVWTSSKPKEIDLLKGNAHVLFAYRTMSERD